MFPGEFASAGDLGETPACWTPEEAAAQKLVAWTGPRHVCAYVCAVGGRAVGSATLGLPFLSVFTRCPNEVVLQWALAVNLLEVATARLCVPTSCCLTDPPWQAVLACLLEALCGFLSPMLCNLSLSGWHSGPSCLVPVELMATWPPTPLGGSGCPTSPTLVLTYPTKSHFPLLPLVFPQPGMFPLLSQDLALWASPSVPSPWLSLGPPLSPVVTPGYGSLEWQPHRVGTLSVSVTAVFPVDGLGAH